MIFIETLASPENRISHEGNELTSVSEIRQYLKSNNHVNILLYDESGKITN